MWSSTWAAIYFHRKMWSTKKELTLYNVHSTHSQRLNIRHYNLHLACEFSNVYRHQFCFLSAFFPSLVFLAWDVLTWQTFFHLFNGFFSLCNLSKFAVTVFKGWILKKGVTPPNKSSLQLLSFPIRFGLGALAMHDVN